MQYAWSFARSKCSASHGLVHINLYITINCDFTFYYIILKNYVHVWRFETIPQNTCSDVQHCLIIVNYKHMILQYKYVGCLCAMSVDIDLLQAILLVDV